MLFRVEQLPAKQLKTKPLNVQNPVKGGASSDRNGIDEKTFKRVQGKAAAGGFSATIRNLVFISCPDVNSLMPDTGIRTAQR